MKQRYTKLLAGALCAVVGLSASAIDRAWGTIEYRRSARSRSPACIYNLTNVTAAGHACLKPSDMSQYPLPADWDPTMRDQVYITFDPNITGHEWGNNTITIDSIEIECEPVPHFFACKNLVALQQGDRSKSMITTTHQVGDASSSNFAGLNFVGAGQGADDAAPDYGGAIHTICGHLNLEKCTFTNFVARRAGGAVCGVGLVGGAYINKCHFYDSAVNGYGGALYLTKHRGVTSKSVYAAVNACTFVGNSAENGGAICGYTAIHDDEVPIRIAIKSSTKAGPMILEDNHAVYEGGAVFTEGDLEIAGTGVVFSASVSSGLFFRSNTAGISGGAICQTGIPGVSAPTEILITNGCIFADNVVSNDAERTMGGAIAVKIPGSWVRCRQFVTFTNNLAWGAADKGALGGAIYEADGVTNDILRTMFVDNFTKAGDNWCYGGAVSAANGQMCVGTCVFDCGMNASDKVCGSAIYFDNAEAAVWNSTFRCGATEAIFASNGSLAFTNCVIVGNGAEGDLVLGGNASATMVYSAYGKIKIDAANGATFVGANNIPDREANEVYDGETLRLRRDCPAARCGIVQPGVTDYDWRNESGSITNTYGRLPLGYSMGAYESAADAPKASTAQPTAVDHTTLAVYTNGVLSSKTSGGSGTWNAWFNEPAYVVYTAENGYYFADGATAVTNKLYTLYTPAMATAPTAPMAPIQVGDDAWALIYDGVCWIYGTGNTWDTKPLWDYRASIADVVVEDGVTGIGKAMFYKFYAVTNATLAASVANVADHAFYNCHSLQGITFQGAVPMFGEQAVKFTAAIRMNGETPEVYTIPNVTSPSRKVWAKDKLTDKAWTDVTGKTDAERGAFHFFKVEME